MPEPITVRIRQYAFTISAPYAKGQKLGEVEEQTLNDLRADNIRNNMTKLIVDATAGLPPGDLLSAAALAELQTAISVYDSRYYLQLKHRPRQRQGAIEAMAQIVAEEWLEIQVTQQGLSPSAQQRAEAIASFLALPEIQEEARRRVSVKQQVAAETMEDLLG